MKSFLIMVLLSTSVFACPELAGNYNCSGYKSGESRRMTVTQLKSKDIITYNFDGEEIVVNGQIRFVTDITAYGKRDMREKFSCKDNKLIRTIYGERLKESELALETVYRRPDGILSIIEDGQVTLICEWVE